MMRMRVPWFDVFALAVLGLLLLATAPRSAEADDKALGADGTVSLAAAAPAEGAAEPSKADESRAKMPTKQEPWPNQDGFIAPTFDGPWRFRFALNAWLPTVVPVTVDGKKENVYLGFILRHLDFYMPPEFYVRKGSFGVYWKTLGFILKGSTQVGPAKIKWDDSGFLMDVGLSYELGRWALGEGPNAPKLTVESTVGARLFYDPVGVSLIAEHFGRSTEVDLSSYVPVIGINTFWDLTEHWNLQISADYGGFGVDDNRQTWQGVTLIGYRWRGFGVGWNIQAGWRAMRIFDLQKKGIDVQMDGTGPNAVFSIEF